MPTKKSKPVASSNLVMEVTRLPGKRQYRVHVMVKHSVELTEGKRLLGQFTNYEEADAAYEAALAEYNDDLIPGSPAYTARDKGLRTVNAELKRKVA